MCSKQTGHCEQGRGWKQVGVLLSGRSPSSSGQHRLVRERWAERGNLG